MGVSVSVILRGWYAPSCVAVCCVGLDVGVVGCGWVVMDVDAWFEGGRR